VQKTQTWVTAVLPFNIQGPKLKGIKTRLQVLFIIGAAH